MYNNPYYQNAYNPQVSIDRINNQIADLEKMRQQLQQPPQQQPQAITQNFQLAPNNNGMKFVNTIDDATSYAFTINQFDFFSNNVLFMTCYPGGPSLNAGNPEFAYIYLDNAVPGEINEAKKQIQEAFNIIG